MPKHIRIVKTTLIGSATGNETFRLSVDVVCPGQMYHSDLQRDIQLDQGHAGESPPVRIAISSVASTIYAGAQGMQ